MDKYLKIFWALIPFIGSIAPFFRQLTKRIISVRSNERDVGKLGKVFRYVLTWPYRLFFLLLCLIWIAALIALYGGLLHVFLDISPNGRFYIDWPITLFNNSLMILISFLALVFVVLTDVVTKGLRWLLRGKTSSWRHDPGWINAAWHLNYGADYKPFNTDINACETVANHVFRAIAIEQVDYGRDRADYPRGLSESEIANYWLIGNTIEDEIHRLGMGRVNFAEVWDAVKTVAAHTDRPFKPEALTKSRVQNRELYFKIRELASDQAQALPDEPKIYARVDTVINKLVKDFQGDAHKLPNSRWKKRPSVKVLWSRLEQFGLSNGIAAQFIKLSKWSKLWPKMEIGPFPYPFAPHIAKLFVNLRCIRVAPNSTTISVDDNFRRLVAWTEDKIVNAVEKYFRTMRDPRVRTFCESNLGCQLEELRREDLIREVDYFLWNQARDSNSVFGQRGQEPWHTAGRDRLIKEGGGQ